MEHRGDDEPGCAGGCEVSGEGKRAGEEAIRVKEAEVRPTEGCQGLKIEEVEAVDEGDATDCAGVRGRHVDFQ